MTDARPAAELPGAVPRLVDPFGRAIEYLRLSVTDRCDLRCVYCMAARPRFVARGEMLSLEELERVAAAFVALGVRQVRITGGEPLARRGVLELVGRLARHLRGGALSELTLTTNGTLLEGAAPALATAGVRRVNVSLDSLDPEVYRRMTRGGHLPATLRGIDAAAAAGLRIKLNAVVLRGENEPEVPALVRWAHARGFDLSLIEAMPLGAAGADHARRFVSLADVRGELERRFTLLPEPRRTLGPARFYRVAETGGRLGFITPLSERFCEACNRVRVTCTGMLHLCVGREDRVDLREPLRRSADDGPLLQAIREGVARKPERHRFRVGDRGGGAARSMAMTGG